MKRTWMTTNNLNSEYCVNKFARAVLGMEV